MGEGVTLVNPAYETAVSLGRLLEEMQLAAGNEHRYEGHMYEFYVSDTADKFKTFANSILKYGILSAKTIHIEDY
jgi:glutamate racemase